MSLFTPSIGYKPFRAPWAFEYWKIQQQIHWLPEEVPLGEDCRDWTQKLTDHERNLLTQIFRFFTQADIEVQDCYHEKYGRVFKPTEVKMMLTAFSNMETIHIAAYSHLLDTIGMPESEYQAFMEYDAMRAKHDYLTRFGVETPEDILTTLAMFGGFTEGVQLFASFAMLMNFPRFNKMKGMGQIVTWSVRDECVSEDTEVLTPQGWLPFPQLTDGQLVAQFDPENAEVTFVVPSRVVRKPYKGELITAEKRHLSFAVTPNHDILFEQSGIMQKSKAKDFKFHGRRAIPTTGWLHNPGKLTAAERLHIAFAADGQAIIGDNRTGERCGYVRAQFTFGKLRKIARLRDLCLEADYRFSERATTGGRTICTVDFPTRPQKDLSTWVNPSEFTGTRGLDFINECLQWDGHVTKERQTFCTTREPEADLLQAVAALSGLTATVTRSVDDRKESYLDYYRVSFFDNETTPAAQDCSGSIDYDGMVYCVSVPTGCFVTRRNKKVVMTGNSLHCEGITRLFKEVAHETGALSTKVIDNILGHAQAVMSMEGKFIDLAFEQGPLEGMCADDIKKYVRYITEWRLDQLGLPQLFENRMEEHPLPWLPPLLNGVEHANFFEARATEYSKGATQGTWQETWTNFDQRYPRT
jgi:ribonucleotide reductase beta subunit family protein with ferritin-like domain